MKKIYIGFAVIGLLALTIMIYLSGGEVDEPTTAATETATTAEPTTAEQFLQDFVAGKTTREVAEYLEIRGVDSPVFAVAFPDRLELTYEESYLNLYDEYFYVSIAPFINETHECVMHVLTGCQGELTQADLEVKITNSSGDVVFAGTQQTYQNGFMGFWLPRNEDYTIEFEFEGYQGEFYFSTHDDDQTCLTEFRLINPNN